MSDFSRQEIVLLSRVEISVKTDISTPGDEQTTVCVWGGGCVCLCVWKRQNSITQQLKVIILAELLLLIQTEQYRRYDIQIC